MSFNEQLIDIKHKFYGSVFLIVSSWHACRHAQDMQHRNKLRGRRTCLSPNSTVWHAQLVADMSATRRTILTCWMVWKSLASSYDTSYFLVTCQRHPRDICYEGAARKLLPWNLGFTMEKEL